ININLLVQGDNPLPVTIGRVYRLFRNLDLDEPGDLTAALIDWIDSGDDEYRILRLPDEQDINVTGAETAYYERLENPYRAKNAPFDSLDELTLVRGFTPEVLQKVAPYLAVFGNDKINLNTASAEVLMAADDMIDRSAAEEILSRRLDQPFESPSEVTTIPRLDTLLHANFAVKSSMFQITADAAVNDGTRRAVAVVSSDGRKVHYMKVD
ncbi:MAG: general secretion pathway protein GspK, partial [Desulfuromonadales bacterium]|nr:general secretion pathway protein GspK [Desulfuromonadales bacterium]